MGMLHLSLICAALVGLGVAVVMEWRHVRKEERDMMEAMRRLHAEAINLV